MRYRLSRAQHSYPKRGTGVLPSSARPTRGIWASATAARPAALRLRTRPELGPFQHFYISGSLEYNSLTDTNLINETVG